MRGPTVYSNQHPKLEPGRGHVESNLDIQNTAVQPGEQPAQRQVFRSLLDRLSPFVGLWQQGRQVQGAWDYNRNQTPPGENYATTIRQGERVSYGFGENMKYPPLGNEPMDQLPGVPANASSPMRSRIDTSAWTAAPQVEHNVAHRPSGP